jgi:hypothetical protein
VKIETDNSNLKTSNGLEINVRPHKPPMLAA